MIILLDLNYTLVANNAARGTTPERMEKRLAGEQYRQWLVELVRPHTVVLITARPVTWMIKTLDRIEEQTGWRPQDACFAPHGWWNPPAIKEHLLITRYNPARVNQGQMLSLEDIQDILRIKLLGVIPESENVLQASNQGTPAIHMAQSDVSEAYKDVIDRFLGEDKPMRFTEADKPGFFKRLFGGK